MTPANHGDGVVVLETCRVAPSNVSPETAALKSLSLTFLDVPWLDFAPSRRLLFYGISDPSPTAFSDVVLPRLKRSLAVTLGQYLPLAGTLTWPPEADEPFLKFDDVAVARGVSLTVAASDADFDRICEYDTRDAAESHPLVPKPRATETEAEIVALQVTAFGNRGFSIGIATHHAILDGRTSTAFLKAWAFICRRAGGGDAAIDLPSNMTPLFDRTEIRDANGAKKAFLEMRSEGRGPAGESKGLKIKDSIKEEPQNGEVVRRLRGTFVLSRAGVEKLRQRVEAWVMQNREQLTGARISTFVLTCAYTWVCLVKAGEFDGEADPTGHFIFAADCRARMDPPVPVNYFGNCLQGCFGDFEFSELAGEDGVAAAAAVLSAEIKKMRESKYPLERKRGPPRGGEPGRRRRMMSVAGSPLFGVYGTDFGWGRPRRVEIVSVEDTGAIGLTESREGDGGVEVGLVLDEDKMEAFATAFVHGLDEL